MKIAVAATHELKEELLQQGLSTAMDIEWIDDLRSLSAADAIIDLLYDTNPTERTALLKKIPDTIVIVSDVTGVHDKPGHFIRINGWPSFLKRPLIEAACNDEKLKLQAEKVFSLFNKGTEWVPDSPGFITSRIVSMIINEAYFALEENVSTREEINIAMKTGTNYPYGPFEWCEKIGVKKVYSLLKKLEETNAGYKPCDLLEKEANN
jgi:3-hydroxybutyryl-CoA dehydrogenase